MKTTTLNRIREHSPYADLWEKLLKGLGKTQLDDEPIPYATIMEICGLDDALLATRAEPEYNWRLLAVAFARRVQHLNPDPRVSGCLDVAERYANGLATDDELAEARAAARAAAGATAALGSADAAWVVTWDASWAIAWDTARVALLAAAGDARVAARAAERKEQEKLFIEFVGQ